MAERIASASAQEGTSCPVVGCGTRLICGNATKIRRRSTANPAALEAVDKKPATGVGAPSYTSGAQKWKGTAEILKPNPTRMSSKLPISPILGAADEPISVRLVVPVKPKSRLKPYSMIAEVSAPNMRYLNPASVDLSSRR